MEHLPKRKGQEESIFPAIPYLCQVEYDEGPFLCYPSRYGLPKLETDGTFDLTPTLSLAHQHSLTSMSQTRLEPFFQNWLFFGLLHEVLGDLYCHKDFIVTRLDSGNEATIVTTRDLISRLEEWEARITQDRGSLMTVYKHIARCLNLVFACLAIKSHLNIDDNLKFHFATVAETLGYAASKACNVAWINSPHQSLISIPWSETITDEFRKSLLLERSNCCPSQIQMLIEHFGSPQSLSFVASYFHEDALQSRHAYCDENSCQARRSVTSDSIPHHVNDLCKCESLGVDEEQLAQCLRRGCLPLLRIREASTHERLSIEVVGSTESTSYVALSHVWVDGLGNPKSTALPRCQVSRLKALVDNLDFAYIDESVATERAENAPEMLLWCDTLCCPVISREARSLALKQMYRTYDQASVVLVLDRCLVSPRVGGMSPDEGCLRVVASCWMTRLWTLQEGALGAKANKLWFQFSKSALPCLTLYQYLAKIFREDISRRGVAEGMIRRFHTFTTLFKPNSKNEGAQMKKIVGGLLYRSVTVRSDEPLIIATLLALDLSQILESEPAERMKVLWRIIGTSPSGISREILFYMGPKILECGLRWAPRSLLSVDNQFSILVPREDDSQGFLATNCNANGLVVEMAGFRLSTATPAKGLPNHLAGFSSIPKDHNDRHGSLLKDCEERWLTLKHRLFRSSHSDRPPAGEEICMIISGLSSPWILHRGSRSLVPENTKGYQGLLVEQGNEHQLRTKELMNVQVKSQVDFCHVPPEMNSICQAAYCLAQELALSAAARHLEDLGTASIDVNISAYQEAIHGVSLESQRLSRSEFAMQALTESGNTADERGSKRINEYIERIYRGIYMHIEEYAPGDTKWCVD